MYEMDQKRRRARARDISKAIVELSEEVPASLGRDIYGNRKLTQLQCLRVAKKYIQNLKVFPSSQELDQQNRICNSCKQSISGENSQRFNADPLLSSIPDISSPQSQVQPDYRNWQFHQRIVPGLYNYNQQANVPLLSEVVESESIGYRTDENAVFWQNISDSSLPTEQGIEQAQQAWPDQTYFNL